MQTLLKQGCASLIAGDGTDQADFIAGKSLFLGESTSAIVELHNGIADAKATLNFDIGHPLPYTTKPVLNVYGASWSIFANSDKAKDLAAWLFMRWFSEPDQQAAWAEDTGYFPARLSAQAKMTDFIAKYPEYKSALALLSQVAGEPPVAGYEPVATPLESRHAGLGADRILQRLAVEVQVGGWAILLGLVFQRPNG